jgi:hypothetical protein
MGEHSFLGGIATKWEFSAGNCQRADFFPLKVVTDYSTDNGAIYFRLWEY